MDFRMTDRFALIRHRNTKHALHPVKGPERRDA